MLTKDLIRARVRGKAIEPSLVDPERYLDDAQALLDTFDDALDEGWSRGELDDAIDDLVGDRRDHKIVRGMAKLLLDRSEFDVHAPVDPSDLRRVVFETARERGPLALQAGKLQRPTARHVLAEVGERWDLDADQMADALYADLHEAQRITSCKARDARWLTDRYNVGLVQALLLRASEVTVRLEGPSVPRLRQLFRYIKFHQLIHHARREGDVVEVRLDGPTSLFRLSTRYGLQLAVFLPALLLQECPWSLRATVLWTRARHEKRLELSSKDRLRSHYQDVGAYETRMQRWFAERFEALDTEWTMDDQTVPIDLGGRAVVLPDFRFTHGGRTAYLEIVGFWRKDYLERRIAWLGEYAPGNLVLAVSRKLRGQKEKIDLPGQVIEFAKILPAGKVRDAVERVAT